MSKLKIAEIMLLAVSALFTAARYVIRFFVHIGRLRAKAEAEAEA